MTMYILARVRSGKEFDTADAINAMLHRPDPDGDLRPIGALAIVPREVIIQRANPKINKPERITYFPLLPRMMFLACTEAHWFRFQSQPMFNAKGELLPPIRREFEILQRSWAGFQDFAARAEQDCTYRIARHEMGKKVRRIRPGQIVEMINATVGDVDLAGRMFKVVKVHGGKVHVQTDVELMGKAVVARLDPEQVGMAAE
jgi:hypothetical protein